MRGSRTWKDFYRILNRAMPKQGDMPRLPGIDDNGEPPPPLDKTADGTQYGLGFRVPAIVVSGYVPRGTISHTQYEFGSILKFVEQTFALGSLGSTDVRPPPSATCSTSSRRRARSFPCRPGARAATSCDAPNQGCRSIASKRRRAEKAGRLHRSANAAWSRSK